MVWCCRAVQQTVVRQTCQPAWNVYRPVADLTVTKLLILWCPCSAVNVALTSMWNFALKCRLLQLSVFYHRTLVSKEIMRRVTYSFMFLLCTNFKNGQETPELSLSPRGAEKPASPTVTNTHKAQIAVFRSLIYSSKDEISAWKFRKKTVTNNAVSVSSGLGTPCCGSWRVRRLRLGSGLG